MLPHKHFIVALVLIVIVALVFYPALSTMDLVLWVVVGGIISAAIDLDVMVLLNTAKLPKKLEKYAKPAGVFKDYKGFMRALCETGVVKKVIVTHFSFSAVLILLFYFFANFYFVPVLLGVLSHLATDIRDVKKAQAQTGHK